jgi:hypothetical protein
MTPNVFISHNGLLGELEQSIQVQWLTPVILATQEGQG